MRIIEQLKATSIEYNSYSNFVSSPSFQLACLPGIPLLPVQITHYPTVPCFRCRAEVEKTCSFGVSGFLQVADGFDSTDVRGLKHQTEDRHLHIAGEQRGDDGHAYTQASEERSIFSSNHIYASDAKIGTHASEASTLKRSNLRLRLPSTGAFRAAEQQAVGSNLRLLQPARPPPYALVRLF
ncbi:hypothetical protein PVAP13_2KG043732 [Panicum virgatum]|uniref:Uncharacterized protein n=1 Tax=Panicum virgatum TaxID=38727 RepID=A0A8T0W905_PANVG|nr:hypothetical protein PVAP13_2KG043732 [Panicum virgatum]